MIRTLHSLLLLSCSCLPLASPVSAQIPEPDPARWQLLPPDIVPALDTVKADSAKPDTLTQIRIWVERRPPLVVGDRNLVYVQFAYDSAGSAPAGEAHRPVVRRLALVEFDCTMRRSVVTGAILLDRDGEPIRRLTEDGTDERDMWDYAKKASAAAIMEHACGARPGGT